MVNKTVAETAPLFRRHQFPELHLYFFRLLDAIHNTDSVYQTNTMRVGHNGRFSEDVSHNQVCTFSADTREFQQGVKIVRNLSAVLVSQDLHTGTDISCLTLS